MIMQNKIEDGNGCKKAQERMEMSGEMNLNLFECFFFFWYVNCEALLCVCIVGYC